MKINRIQGTLHLPQKQTENLSNLILEEEKADGYRGPSIPAIAAKIAIITATGAKKMTGVRENRPGHWQAYCRENGKWRHLYQGPSLGKAIDERLKWEALRDSRKDL